MSPRKAVPGGPRLDRQRTGFRAWLWPGSLQKTTPAAQHPASDGAVEGVCSACLRSSEDLGCLDMGIDGRASEYGVRVHDGQAPGRLPWREQNVKMGLVAFAALAHLISGAPAACQVEFLFPGAQTGDAADRPV